MGLIEDAVERVSLAWNSTMAVTTVLAEHHERAVFQTRSPQGPVVVKVDSSVAKHRREESVLRAAGHAGLPVPAVVHSEAGPPPLLVLQFIDGQPLGPGTDRATWRHAGHVLRRLHGLDWPAGAGAASWSGRSWPDHFRWWADHERGQWLTDGSLPAPVVHQMHRYLSTTFSDMDQPEPHLLHGDCQTDHYLVGAGSPHIAGVLDLGDAVLGDSVWDLAILTLDAPEMLPEIFGGYQPDAATERRAHRFLPAYQLIRRLGSATWMREHGQPHTPDLDAALRILERHGSPA
jgi:aminoglycoside phosphotransferase (APT) family kinase protein